MAAARAKIARDFPQAGFDIRDWTDPAPSLRREADRFTQFINFVGLTALLLGGIGVGNAIQSYMTKKREIIATFKCLGASSRLVLAVYLIQALLLTAIGIAIGLIIGALTPALLATIYSDTLPIALALEPHALPLLTAALAGLLTMVLFVLWPLGRAASVSPAILMRSHLSDEPEPSAWRYAVGAAIAGLALFALAIAASEERAITASISAGIVAAFLLLTVFGLFLQRYAARFRRTRPPSLALALTSIAGPNSLARSIAVSLGLGLGLLVAVALIHRSLYVEITNNIAIDAPGLLLPRRRSQGPRRLPARSVRKIEPGAKLDQAPMLRGRIVALKGVPAEKAEAAPDTRWVLAGDRGLTYTDAVPGASTLVAGEWWPKGYAGPPLVSFDADLAKGLGLKLGDPITVNILGRNVDATIASFRKIDWESLAINFVMVFSPNTLRRRAPSHAGDARISQGHAAGARRQGDPGAGRGLPPRHRDQGRRHRRGGQGHAGQSHDRHQRDGRRHASDRRRRARGRRRRGPGAAQISRRHLQDARRHARAHSLAPSCSSSACPVLPRRCSRS